MADDWFAANAPSAPVTPAPGGDWFAANAPSSDGKGVAGRLWDSFVSALPHPIDAIKEWANRPAEVGKAMGALHTLNQLHNEAARDPQNQGKPVNQWVYRQAKPEEKAAIDAGMTAQLHTPEGNLASEATAPAIQSGKQMASGDVAGGFGTLLGAYAAPVLGAKIVGAVVPRVAAPIRNLLEPSAPVTTEGQFAAEHGVPVPKSVQTGSKFTSAAESYLSNALGSSGVMEDAAQNTRAGLSRVGGEIADQVAPPATPESAGESLQQSAAARETAIAEGKAAQDAAIKKQGQTLVDGVHPTPATSESAGAGIAKELQSTEKAAGAGASASYSRLAEIENAPENLRTVKTGEKPNPEADQWSQGLAGKNYADLEPEEQAKVRAGMKAAGMSATTDINSELALPVDMRPVKTSLQPIYDELKRTMPIAQQQASRGLKAIENIINGDDYVSASTADANLGAVKAIEREAPNDKTSFLARKAIDAFSPAVDEAISGAGTDAADALQQGRALTKAKYATRDTFEQLPDEPVKIYRTLTAPGDTNINLLRDVKAKAPQSIPAIGRAMIQGLMEDSQASGVSKAAQAWDKIGDATKLELLGTADKVAAVDRYFNTAKDLESSPVPAGMIAPGPAVPGEPVRAYSRLTQDKDVAIQALRDAAQTSPEAIPQVARAKLQEIVDMVTTKPATAFSKWANMGDATKEILYPDPVMRKQIDDFMSTAKKTSEAIDRNTSRTSYVNEAAKTVKVLKDVFMGTASVVSAGLYPAVNYALAKALTTPGVALKFTQAMNLAAKALPVVNLGAKATMMAADAAQLSALTGQVMKAAGITSEQLQIEAPKPSIATTEPTPVKVPVRSNDLTDDIPAEGNAPPPFKIGDTVNLRGVGPVVIKKVNPDYTFEY